MKTRQKPTSDGILKSVFAIGVLLFAGNFLYARLFGVYDDDFIFTVPPFFWSRSEAWIHIKEALISWPQGRPVGFALTHLLSYISAQSSSLGLGYLLGFAILLLNALLICSLAKRFVTAPAALFAASVYVLYPADTGKVILMHRVNLHLNVTFVLLALLYYLRGPRWVAYILAPLCFMIHEPVYGVFLLAPLLVASPRQLSWKKCLGHGMLCLATVTTLLLIRRQVGDPRIAETFGDPLEVVKRIAYAVYIGPVTVLGAMITRPLEAIRATDAQNWIVVGLCAGVFYAVGKETSATDKPSQTDNPRERALCMAGAGAIGLVLGYILCFRDDYWPPIMTIGRISGYHASGSVGASLLAGGIFGWLLETGRQYRSWLIAAAALYCGLLVSFGLEVQRIDYVKHAEQQAQFWRKIIDTSGEWTPQTIILVDISGTDPSRPFTPGMPIWWTVNFAPTFLERLVQWPESWPQDTKSAHGPRPRVYGYQSDFGTLPDGDSVVVKTPAWLGADFWPHVRDGGFLYFRFTGGRMIRVTEPVVIGGKTMHPMSQPAEPPPELRTSRFYDMLFIRETDWQTILHARNYPR